MTPWASLLRQPVLVVLFATALGVFGLAAVATLPIRASPIIPTRLVDVQTGLPGADAQTMDKFVTLVLESSITSLSGVKYVTGTTQPGQSDIHAFLDDDADPDTVFAEVLAAVNAQRQNLPQAIEVPNVTLIGDDNANQELNAVMMFPPTASLAAVTEYVQTNIVPRLETIPGIGPVTLESDTPALRVEMDPLRMQALGITPAEVATELGNATAVNSGGVLRDAATAMQVNIRPGLASAADFEALPVPTHNGATVPLRSFATASIGFSGGAGVSWWDRRGMRLFSGGHCADREYSDSGVGVFKNDQVGTTEFAAGATVARYLRYVGQRAAIVAGSGLDFGDYDLVGGRDRAAVARHDAGGDGAVFGDPAFAAGGGDCDASDGADAEFVHHHRAGSGGGAGGG